MKKLCCVLVILVMLLSVTNVVLAAEDSIPPSPVPATQTNNVLSIDNTNLYSGMDKPYSSGYMPTVANNTAHLILPVVSSQELQGNSLNMTVDLGDPQDSPFVFQNYDQTVTLVEHTVNDGTQKVNAYLIELSLPLIESRVNGRYPVTINLQGQTKGNSSTISQAFTLYVTIPDGLDPNASQGNNADPQTDNPDTGSGIPTDNTAGGGEDEPAPQPKAMVSSYTVNPSPVVAGKEFDLSVTLLNTSDSQSMNNVKVTINGETSDVIPMGETNSFYFKKIGKKDAKVINTKMMVQQSAEPKPQKLTLHIEYEGAKATAYTSDESIIIQVKQPMRVEYDAPEIPKEVNAGDTMSISLNVMNMGRGTVYNVRAELEAPGLVPEGSLFIGNLESGAAKKSDLYVFVSTLNSKENGSDSNSNYGATSGKIILSYEDVFGEVTSQTIDLSTTINPPVINAVQEQEPEEPQTQSQWWISVLIIAVIIACIFIGYFIKKNQTKKKDAANEDI